GARPAQGPRRLPHRDLHLGPVPRALHRGEGPRGRGLQEGPPLVPGGRPEDQRQPRLHPAAPGGGRAHEEGDRGDRGGGGRGMSTAAAREADPMTPEHESISRPPSGGEMFRDRAFRSLCRGLGWLTILVVFLLVGLVAWQASPAIRLYGLHFFGATDWDPGKGQFGILADIWGTLYSSVLGVLLGGFFGVVVAIFLTEHFLPPWLENVFRNIVNLLAAIPSVVYGLWGIFVVIPAIRPFCNWLHTSFGWFPLFSTPLLSVGMMPAALVLAIMVLPTVTAISRDALESVNPRLREAAYGLGATRWETILAVIL